MFKLEVIENPLSIFSILPAFDEDPKDPTTLIQEYIQICAQYLIAYVKNYLQSHIFVALFLLN